MNCTVSSLEEQTENRLYLTPVLDKDTVSIIMILGFGGLSVSLAVVYKFIRSHIYGDADNVDRTFDAGGRVSVSITAVTVASQYLWPADFLQGTTIMMKVGLSAVFYTVAIVLGMGLFPLLTVNLKTKAPGAKTYLQVMNARFGKVTHLIFIGVAMVASFYILVNIILVTKAVFDVLVEESSDELLVIIMAVLCGSYCCIGGLGSTFYVSYFNLVMVFTTLMVIIIKNTNLSETENSIYSMKLRYEAMSCLRGPAHNFGNSLITFRSLSGGIVALLVFVNTTAVNIFDQAFWQSRIATSPKNGVLGIFFAMLIWFTIGLVINHATITAYASMVYQNGTHFLSNSEIESGYITPFVLQKMMGNTGAYLMLTLITMSLMSTGSGEIMAISSIIVYDIYKTYINPFSSIIDSTYCQLCGKRKFNKHVNSVICTCVSSRDCDGCQIDISLRDQPSSGHAVIYSCSVHGQYRHYEDQLLSVRTWCIVGVSICFVPFGLIVLKLGINLYWFFVTFALVFVPFVVPMLFSLFWARVTAPAIISGCIAGLFASISVLLVVAMTYYKDSDLSNFLVSTTQDYSILGGLLSGLVVSTSGTVTMTLCSSHTSSDPNEVWMTTLAIDNPLLPWRREYQDELPSNKCVTFPTPEMMSLKFKSTRRITVVGVIFLTMLFGVVFPAVMFSFEKLSFTQFLGYIRFFEIWCAISALLTVLGPPAEEIRCVWKQMQKNKRKGKYNATKLKNHIDDDIQQFIPGQKLKTTAVNI